MSERTIGKARPGPPELIASGLGTPVLRLAAAGHGVRHALAVRRAGQQAGIRSHRGGGSLRALPERERGEGDWATPARRVPAVPAPPLLARARRETWRERTDRLRAARDGAQR